VLHRSTASRAAIIALLTIAVSATARAALTDDQLIARVGEAVLRHKLVADLRCVSFVITRKVHPSIDQVELRERHDAACGGDPGTEPRLFEVIVDRTNGQMATNTADPSEDGMEMLR
jgi:hypothetical protein